MILCPLDALQVNSFLDHFPERRHFTKAIHVLDNKVYCHVNLFFGGESTKTKANGSMGEFLVHSNSTEYVRRFKRGRSTGTTTANSDVLQRHQERLTLNVCKGQVEVTRVPAVCIAVQNNICELRRDALVHTFAQLVDPLGILLKVFHGDSARGTKTYAQRCWESTASQAALLAPTADDGLETNARASADVKGTNTLGTVNFMSGNRHQIDLHIIHIQLHFAKHLCTVRMKEHLIGTANLANILERLNDTNLVVDTHNGNDRSIVTNGALHHVGIYKTIRAHGQVGDVKAFVFQHTARIKHALVFSLRGNDVLLAAFVKAGNTLDRQVVGFCGSRGENDLLCVSVDHVANFTASLFNSLLSVPTIDVCARMRVSEALLKPWHHFIQNAGVHRCGGLKIKVRRATLRRLLGYTHVCPLQVHRVCSKASDRPHRRGRCRD
mmetsp:Transcript_928/g.1829  ORF Transcript_928/g.1829 Transcript_928/m.1829 type:complete len:438 (+) Transcript_928:3313-4626(+)